MQNHLAGEDLTLQVPLRINNEPVVPDAGSVRFTVRDNAGLVVVDKEPVAMAAGSTFATVVVDAAYNTLDGSRFSMRTVVVEFTKTGRPVRTQINYRLTEWLNISVDEEAVRGFIGIDHGELPDKDIDIVDAYLQVEELIGEVSFRAALASAGPQQRSANKLVLAQAILNQIPGLPQRISQSESNGVFSATRAKLDIVALEARANALYAENLGLLVVEIDPGQSLLLAPALAPDPITGA